jgi:pimeloyl-ACP methyl ester carboxylesterase
MPVANVNGVNIFWKLSGQAEEPIVLVHGSWIDHHNWDPVASLFARSHRVLAYDRRGHSQSERPETRYSIRDDVADLAALIEKLRLAPAHIIGNSSGGSVVLRLAAERPDLFRSLIVIEPALLDLQVDDPRGAEALRAVRERLKAVTDLLAGGQMEEGARQFVETVAFGPGAWADAPEEVKQTVLCNAPAFLAQMRDPDFLSMDLARLRGFPRPALLILGEQGQPYFPPIVEAVARVMPHAERLVFPGAGHEPEQTHPEGFVAAVADFIGKRTSSRQRDSLHSRRRDTARASE